MDNDSPDSDAFFEALAGRRQGVAGAEALSHAIRAQARTTQAAERASSTDWTAHEQRQMAALRQRLADSGVPPVPKRQATARPGWAERLRHLLMGGSGSLMQPFAIAACVMLATVVVVKMAPEVEPDPSTQLRGSSMNEVRVDDPAAVSAALDTDLRSLGADVLTVQISADEWQLLVRAVPPAADPRVTERLRQQGLEPPGPPPYELKIHRQSP